MTQKRGQEGHHTHHLTGFIVKAGNPGEVDGERVERTGKRNRCRHREGGGGREGGGAGVKHV